MPFVFERARSYLSSNNLTKLFIEEMGWDHPAADLVIQFNGESLKLAAIAQKRGMQVFRCPPLPDGRLPDYAARRKIEALVRKSAHEHLIVFTNADHSQQKWQWVRHEPGRPTACREYDYARGQSGDALLQRLQHVVFDFEEEEGLTILDVTRRARAAFDLERVTKRFYERFTGEHAAFMKFLRGIPDEAMQRWYVSVTLNRLMFVYFIQKKGFLNGDPDYLRTKLTESGYHGPDRYYRDFLCPLFFEGFARKKSERSPETRRLLGEVPYLNGGIFQRHQIEEAYGQAIHIPDAAFQRLFEFFEGYRWHLDERPLRADNEINPDVLGYIFEKYINQKQMGAYYTKEDITEYIGKYTILPFIFDQARRLHREIFEGDDSLWALLEADPDRYIYPAVRHGADLPLPPEIAAGVEDVAQRGEWNKSASPEYALPTETWREAVARRQRCQEVRRKLANGEIRAIDDFITYNLDLRQFAQDAIESLPTPEALRAFLKAVASIRVLDPTVGSGAFLFAALNILEPLYEALFGRMQAFLDEMESAPGKHRPEKFKDFRGLLAQMAKHPNPRYFILKSIILYNLHGVDIMDEAVEICKLRLFLKLVAQVERAGQIEPLPDIDFNIRAGNTLVGFASKDEVQRAITFGKTKNGAVQAKMFLLDEDQQALQRIEQQAEDVDRLYRLFQQQQTELGGVVSAGDKQALRQRLEALDDELNRLLARQYGVELSDVQAYAGWLVSHRPFHWFVEFYGVMKGGGFDVVIGNPPYVEYSKVKSDYTLRYYMTEECGNLYAFVVERNISLMNKIGRTGMIIPHSAFCTDRMAPIMSLFSKRGTSWVSTYDIRPAKLFVGVDQRLAIYISSLSTSPQLFSTRYHRWNDEARPTLFTQLNYTSINNLLYANSFPKVGSVIECSIWEKLHNHRRLEDISHGQSKLYFHNAPRYWIRAMISAPYFWNERDGEKLSTQVKELFASQMDNAKVVAAILNSSIYYWWFVLLSDCRHLNMREIERFPVGLSEIPEAIKYELVDRCDCLMKSYSQHSVRKESTYKATGKVVYDEYYPRYSKAIIDGIDQVLASHYGLTNEELDFIINYDIKYRMGQEEDGGEE